MLFYFACEAAGASAPGIPHAFSWKGGKFSHTSGAFAPRERGHSRGARGLPRTATHHSPLTIRRHQTRTRGPITAGSSFARRPPTQEPSCPGLSRASTSLLVARKSVEGGGRPAHQHS